jgi:hypothetical protein
VRFSFWLGPTDDQQYEGAGLDPVDFAGYLMRWDGKKAIGPVLFASSMVSTTNTLQVGEFDRFDFNTGGLVLEEGAEYVAFVSASNFFDGDAGVVQMSTGLHNNPYPDGAFVFNINGQNFDLLTTTDWDSLAGTDAQFFASFSETTAPIPEPGSLALLALGGAAVYASRRRRKQQRVVAPSAARPL